MSLVTTSMKYYTMPAFIFLFILISSLLVASQASADSTTTLTHTTLVQRYDSLDLEKQKNKRIGNSIIELEIRQQAIRDSLKILHEQIQSTDTAELAEPPAFQFALLKPQTVFDWIILVVGGIAVFSGIFLFFGVFSMLSRKQKKQIMQKSSKPAKQIPASTQTSSPSPTRSITALQALEDNISDPVKKLRKQIQMGDDNSEQPTQISTKFETGVQPALQRSEITNHYPDGDQHQKVIGAAKKGMSLHEISRTFHLSEDHVALILKVARKK